MSDLIDRQAAIEAHCELCGDRDKCNCDICPDVEVFQLLSSAQPEPKTGRWISDRLVSTNGGTYGVRRCSACEAYFRDIGYGWNFCPNCGAYMRGDEP